MSEFAKGRPAVLLIHLGARWQAIGATQKSSERTWGPWRRQATAGEAKELQIEVLPESPKPWYLVNPKMAGKWMFIPLKMYL
jgi:hypothetical protein